MVRAGSEAGGLEAHGASVVRGDLTEPDSLRAACESVSTVVASATVIGRRLAGARKPSIHDADEVGMASLVTAAESAGVERFVYVSFAGADAALGTALERAKIATEKRLLASAMRAVIVRPDAFQEIHLGPLGRFDVAAGKVSVFGHGDSRRRWVGTEDVAALVASLAVEPDPPELVEFGGPEALSRNEAVAIAERLTGRQFKVQRMPRPIARLAILLLNRPNDALASAFGGGLLQDLVESTWDDGPLLERGITPRSASEFLREQVAELS